MAIGTLALAVKEYIQRQAEGAVISRGRSYHKKGLVFDHKLSPNGEITVKVLGTDVYDVMLILKSDQTIKQTTCNCPYSGFGICKHQVASLLWLVDHEYAINTTASGRSETMTQITPKKTDRGSIKKSTASALADPKKPIKPSKKKFRTADKPYTIPDFTTLSRKDFLARHIGNLRMWGDYDSEPMEVTGVDSFVWVVWHRWNSRTVKEKHTVILKISDADLSLSCSCGEKGEKLCEHAAVLLLFMIDQKSLKNLIIPDQESQDKTGRQAMDKFGFGDDDWNHFFEIQFRDFAWSLKLRPEYGNLMSMEYWQQSDLTKLFEPDAEKDLAPSIYGNTDEPYEIGYAFGFNNGEFYIDPIVARKDRHGQAMKMGFSLYRKVRHSRHILKAPADPTLLAMCETFALAKSIYNRRNADDDDQMEQLQLNAPALEKHPYLYYNSQPLYDTVKKGALSPIRLKANSPEITYHLTEEGRTIRVNLTLSENGKTIALNHQNAELVHDRFLKTADTLYLLNYQEDAKHIHFVMNLEGKAVMENQFPIFFENYLKYAFKKHTVNLEKMKSYSLETKNPVSIGKELYLSEIGNFVLFKPFVRYQENLMLNILSEKSTWTLRDKKFLESQQNTGTVEEFKADLAEIHPTIMQQMRTDYLHLSYSELMRDNIFLDMFAAFEERQIKVFGVRDLKGLKVSPYKGKIMYTVASNTDWFDINLKMAWGDTELSIDQLKKHFRPGSEYIELGNGSRGLIPAEWLKKLERIFRHGSIKNGKLEISKKKFSLVDELFENLEDPTTAAFIKDKNLKLLNFEKLHQHDLPKGIKAKLRHYQVDGFQWLNFLDDFQWGGILADDMGLGKTLQVIVFLKHILQKSKQTNLVVVPTSLLFNWENEIKKFAPSLKSHFYYGADRIRSTVGFEKHQIILTSYGHMLSDIELLKEYKFNYVILDESQAIKNPASKRFKAARLLKANNRLAMTGTPIENNTFDLYAQMSFLNPGFLGSAKSFKDDFAKPIDSNRDAEKGAELQRLIKPFVLRRTKEQVAKELPDKTEEVLYCELEKDQQKVYDAHRNEFRNTLLGKMEDEGVAKSRFAVLAGLTKLRQICDSPELLPGEEKYQGKSVKIDLLMMHIKEKTANHKILVFSQFVTMLKLIENRINDEKIPYAYLDGKSSMAQRQESVKHFQGDEDCRVFLISLKAGGTGLNLMAADYVYIMDPGGTPL